MVKCICVQLAAIYLRLHGAACMFLQLVSKNKYAIYAGEF